MFKTPMFKIDDRVRVTGPEYEGGVWDCDATVTHFDSPFVYIETDIEERRGGFYPESLTLIPSEPKLVEIIPARVRIKGVEFTAAEASDIASALCNAGY